MSGPTHKDNHTLDVVITRECENIIHTWSTSNPRLSDHMTIHTKLSLARPRPSRLKKQFRKLRSVDATAFRNDVITSALFSSSANNVDELCDQYDSELRRIVNTHAPFKTCLITSRLAAPWYSEEISIEKCKCRRLERRWRKSGLEVDKQQHADQYRRVRELIK